MSPVSTSLAASLRQHAAGSFKRAAVSGGLAGLFSLLTLVWRGRRELGRPAAPLNAPGQWVYGEEALRADRADVKHTLPGVVIHQASAVFWGLLFDQLWQRARGHTRQGDAQHLPALAAGAVGLTAVAAVVDLKTVPDRLTPGFEKRLSSRGVFMVYASFAVGLAAGALLLERRQGRKD